MSIESDLSSIAKSLAAIAAHLTATPVVAAPVTVAAVTTPVAVTPVPEVKAPEAPKPPVAAAPVVVVTPVPVATPSTAPFANAAELTAYVMAAYKTLGPIKGAKIQEVLQSVGAKNINDVKPEHYATVKAGVDALSA